MNENKYAEAEKLLEKALKYSERKHGPDKQFKGKDNLLNLLASAYGKGRKAHEVEELVQSYPQLKEDNSLEILCVACSRMGEVDKVEKILKTHAVFNGREKALKELVFAYFREMEWDKAEEILLDVVECKGDELDQFEAMHTIAEVYLAKNKLESAIKFCETAVKGRRKSLGEHHDLYYDSLCLLASIFFANEKPEDAENYTHLVPSTFWKGLMVFVKNAYQ